MATTQKQDGVIILLALGTAAGIFLLSNLLQIWLAPSPGEALPWMIALFLNLIGYSTVLLPGYLVIQYVRQTNYLEKASLSLLQPLVNILVKGGSEIITSGEESVGLISGEEEKTASKKISLSGGMPSTILLIRAARILQYLGVSTGKDNDN